MANMLLLFFLPFLAYGLDNGLVKLPPMGWMSWSRFFCETDCVKHPQGCINEQLYKLQARRLVNDGYRELGYTHVHIDDCWSEKGRTSEGKLSPDHSRFPSGIPALVQFMHDRGLKLGLYGDVGFVTCAGYPASYGHEKIDAQTFADWNVDYMKFDGCNLNIPELQKGYQIFGDYLNETGKQIVYSCEWPFYEMQHQYTSNYTAIAKTCNLFRNFNDVANSFDSVLSIIAYYIKNQDEYVKFHGPGQWFDPVTESRTQMAVWSAWSAPLIMSNDLRVLESELRDILQNKRVIAVDQDPLGIMAKMVNEQNKVLTFLKPMTPVNDKKKRYSYAIVLMNKSMDEQKSTIRFNQLNMTNPDGYQLQNLWTGEDLGVKKPEDSMIVRVAGHDSAKTVKSHPQLPGTIYTAAEELKAAGALDVLPLPVDIRDEEAVRNAVEKTVQKFGGIDYLINTRGTFLVSKMCIPHLQKSEQPQIMNLSPPLCMEAQWFAPHLAYTMSKYGMSLCVLGMSEEFKDSGIAVNALWPKTLIWTAAMKIVSPDPNTQRGCRKPEIMADAAYHVLQQKFTGKFVIDEEVLREAGITNFDQYAYDPTAKLIPDGFIPGGRALL
ncbi:Alpha-galactosidase [Aphelenchoides besseyi]|nr:Alpha-galactosidase [Aphelenchoides besseyi]